MKRILVGVVGSLIVMAPSVRAESVTAPFPREIWINEVMANPYGADTGNEWIELANVSDHPLNLAGLKVVRPSGTVVLTIPAGTLAAGGFVRLMTATLINTGDTLTLRGTNDLDHVVYDGSGPEGSSWSRLDETSGAWTATPTPGQPNLLALPTPTRAPTPSAAVSPSAFPSASPSSPQLTLTPPPIVSVEPIPAPTLPSPAAVSPAPTPTIISNPPSPSPTASASSTPAPSPSPGPTPTPGLVPSAQPGEVWINEFLPNPTGSDPGQEWVELHNVSDHEVDLTGLVLQQQDGDVIVRLSGPLPADGYQETTALAAALLNGGDTLELRQNGQLIDEVTYDTAPDGESWARQSAAEGTWTTRLTPGSANLFPEAIIDPPLPLVPPLASAPTTATTAAAPPVAKTVATKTAVAKASTAKKATASGTRVATKAAASSTKKSLPSSGQGALVYLVALGTFGAYGIWQWKQR